MNEVILFIIFAVVIFGGYFLLRRIQKPTISYIRILMALAMLVLVWWDWDEKNKGTQYILTALAVASIIREFFELRKFQKKAQL
jgi:hypothetical protein